MCYSFAMDAPKITARTSRRSATFTIGRKRLERISAVEGIETSPESRAMFVEFDRRGLSDQERRSAIFEKHARKA